MVFKKSTDNGNSINQSESEIPLSLDTLIDLLSELNQVKSTPKERITKPPLKPTSNSYLPLAIKQEPKSPPTLAVEKGKEQEPKDHPLGLGRTKNTSTLSSQNHTPIKHSVKIADFVSLPHHPSPPTQSLATLQQEVSNLEQKLQAHQEQVEQVMDSVNSLLSLTVELINLQPNGSPSSIIKTIAPLIDRIIEQRSREDLRKMGAALANILPVAINQQIQATPQSIAKALAPEIALSIQEQVRLDKESISQTLGPEMGKAIKAQIELERDAMVDALYPVIGSTIAKYMSEVIYTINEKVENAFSLEGVRRKIRAKIQGVSEAELILQEAIPYTVQAIFLIHKASGLVICELQPDLDHQLESDLLAGMLTAIRSFATDLITESSELDEIDYGESKIILEVAGYCYLAVVVKGEPSQQFRQKIRETLSNVVLKHGNTVRVYDGDSETIPQSLEFWLEKLLEQDQKRIRYRGPTALICSLALMVGLLGGVGAILSKQSYEADRIEQQTAFELDAAPELSVYHLSPKVEPGKLILRGRVPSEYLRQKAAQTVTKIARAEALSLENRIIAINVPIDPTLAQEEVARVTSLLNYRQGVAILTNYQDYTVTVSGFSLHQLGDDHIAQSFSQIPGVEKVILSLEPQLPKINRRIYFPADSSELNSADLTKSLNQVEQLLVLYPQLHLRIIGHSDRSGSPQDNHKLARERARQTAQALVAQGIDSTRLQVLASRKLPPGVRVNQPLAQSRCVRFEFFIPPRDNNLENS